jgi:hypothetical protein
MAPRPVKELAERAGDSVSPPLPASPKLHHGLHRRMHSLGYGIDE